MPRAPKLKTKEAKNFVRLNSKSPIMEAYRLTRTNIEFADASTDNRAILFTSSVQDEGKSTTVANLARTFAQSGYKTLIIDFDLRKPVLHKIFSLPGNVGATSVVTNRATLSEAIKPTDEQNLYVLPSGVRPVSPAEFLRSNGVPVLIDFLKTKFDMILIDSPPSMNFADAAILSTYVDSVILVVSAKHADYKCIQMSINNLANVNANIIGCIMNSLRMKDSSYKYKYKYYYHY